MMMGKTTMPTRRVSYHRRKAKLVLSARRAILKTRKTMPTMSVGHHQKQAKALHLLRKRESSRKEKPRRIEDHEKEPKPSVGASPLIAFNCGRDDGTGGFALATISPTVLVILNDT
jgi:hypothetical protein